MIGLFLGLKRLVDNIQREHLTPPIPTYRTQSTRVKGIKNASLSPQL